MNFDDTAFAQMLEDYSVFNFILRITFRNETNGFSYVIWNWFVLILLGRVRMQRVPLYIYLYIYLFIDIYGTCVFRIHIHPAPFVRDAIFPHLHIGSYHVTTVAQETRLTGQKG